MGFLKNAAASMGHVDKGLLKHGLLARGHVTQCERTSVSTGNQVMSVICKLTVDVELEDRPTYTAHCKHPIQIPYLPQFESGQAIVSVRVDPDDEQNIVLDLASELPPPRPGGVVAGDEQAPNREGKIKAAEVLATGTPCRVIVQECAPLGMQKEGRDVWGMVLNVITEGGPATQARVGLAVPPEAVALLFPGSNLPAKRRADIEDAVVPDWDAAVAAAH